MPAPVSIRSLRATDLAEFTTAARASRRLHGRWVQAPEDAVTFERYVARFDGQAHFGFVVCRLDDGRIAGAVNVTHIVRGAFCSGYLGYFAFAGHQGQGLMAAGLQAVVRHAFGPLKLHRLEANIQPGNRASIALAQRCGFAREGYSPAYLKVRGHWCDHERWARLGLALALAAGVGAGCAPLGGLGDWGPAPSSPRVITMAAWGGTPAAAAAGAAAQATTPGPQRATGSAPARDAARPPRITRLTVHHQGVAWQPGADVPAYLRRLQAWSRESRRWSDLPYHYIVAPDGQVYEGRAEAVPGDTQTDYDPRGHLLVMLLGNFERQQPSAAQWDATVDLLVQLSRRHGLDAAALGMHRQFTAQTVCPGAHLAARIDELRSAVDTRLGRGA